MQRNKRRFFASYYITHLGSTFIATFVLINANYSLLSISQLAITVLTCLERLVILPRVSTSMAPIYSNFDSDDVQLTWSNLYFLFVSLLFVVVFVCTLAITCIVCTGKERKKELPPPPPIQPQEEVRVVVAEGKEDEKILPAKESVSLKSATSPSLSQRSVNLSTIKEEGESQVEIKYECSPVNPRIDFQTNQSRIDQSFGLYTMKPDDRCIPTNGLTILSQAYNSKKAPRSKSVRTSIAYRSAADVVSSSRIIGVDISSNMSGVRSSKALDNTHFFTAATA